jgi:hypothetical protein
MEAAGLPNVGGQTSISGRKNPKLLLHLSGFHSLSLSLSFSLFLYRARQKVSFHALESELIRAHMGGVGRQFFFVRQFF